MTSCRVYAFLPSVPAETFKVGPAHFIPSPRPPPMPLLLSLYSPLIKGNVSDADLASAMLISRFIRIVKQ